MSWWTYVSGIVEVTVHGRTQHEVEYILKTVLDHLPLVTGSERDMTVHIIKKEGLNCSSSVDEFGESTNNLVDHYGRKNRQSGWLDVTDTYYLLVEGSFRDRRFEQTYREFQKWLCRLSKRLEVDDVLVKIKGYDKKVLITNRNDCYTNMNEYPSWSKESDGEPAWWEYLMWIRDPLSDYPALLAYKYFDDAKEDKFIRGLLKQ